MHLSTRLKLCKDPEPPLLTDSSLKNEWKPSKSRMVLVLNGQGDRLTIFVDPRYPMAWKRKSFYKQIKQWATWGLAEMAQVIVDVGGDKTLVLPTQDITFGRVPQGMQIVTALEETTSGIKATAYLADER